MRQLALLLALSGLVISVAPSESQAKDYWFDFQRVVETGPEARLSLNFVSGDLTIVSSEDDRVVIEAAKRVHAVSMEEAQLVADHIEIKIKHDKNKVDVTANYLRMRNRGQSFWSKVLGTGGEDSFGEVNWTIRVPADCHIHIVNTSGSMEIGNIRGDLDIRSSAADIVLSSIEGAVNIENSAGVTRGELLFGPVTIRQAQGEIDLNFIEGDIKVKSSIAGIAIRQDRGALDLTTSSGNVDIQTNLDSSREYFVQTESGNIRLSIPETSSGDLRIDSKTGEIRTDIPIAIKSMTHKQVEGVFGFGGVKINLTSISGDVTVAQF